MKTLTTFFNHATKLSLDEKVTYIAGICLIALGFSFPTSHAAASISTVCILVLSLLSKHRTSVFNTVKTHKVALLCLLFYGFILSSMCYTSADFSNAMNDASKYSRFLLVPCLITLFSQENLREKAIKVFLLAMLLTSLITYAKYFDLLHFKTLSADDVFMNRIQTGFLTAFAAFLAAHRIVIQQRLDKNYFILFLLFTSNIFITNTGRTGLLTYCILATLFIFQKANKKYKIYLLMGFVLTILLLTVSSYHLRTMTFTQPIQDISKLHQGNPEVTSIGARITMARYALNIATNHPILGTGVGSHHTEYAKYDLIQFSNGLRWGDPHNQYLLIFFEFGAVGLIFLLYIFYMQLRLSLQLPTEAKYLAQGIVVAMMFGCLCDSLLYAASTGTLYVYFTSLAFGSMRQEPRIDP